MTMLLAGIAAPALAQSNFTLFNNTGFTIARIYVSPSNGMHGSWGDDLLGDNSLNDGGSVDISVQTEKFGCLYDLMFEYEVKPGRSPGDEFWEKIDFCKITKVTLRWNGKVYSTKISMQ